MNNQELEQSAHELIAKKIQNKQEVQVSWAVQEMINAAGGISGDGCEFYTLCAQQHVYRVVKKVVDKYEQKASEVDEAQLVFREMQHLRSAYTFERDGERVLVPIELLSIEELENRALEFDAQAIGLRAHADEIRRYISWRRQNANVA